MPLTGSAYVLLLFDGWMMETTSPSPLSHSHGKGLGLMSQYYLFSASIAAKMSASICSLLPFQVKVLRMPSPANHSARGSV